MAAPSPLLAPIVVAAATYHRPEGLARLLTHLEALAFEGRPPPVSVLVVDNSAEGDARAAVETRAQDYRFPLLYVHERERGIAQARNRALQEAIAIGARWLAFLDDDEYPDPAWLEEMRRAANAAPVTAVIGALEPVFAAPPPAWLARGDFLAITRYADGAELPFGNTSNAFLDLAFVARHDLAFDRRFALTGGEDVLFFARVREKGGRIVFSRKARVFETIVPARATLGWLLMRWTRSGNTDGRIAMLMRPGLGVRLVTVFTGGLARLAVGGARALLTSPMALLGAGDVPAEALRVASRGWGFVRAALGSVIEEYRHPTR